MNRLLSHSLIVLLIAAIICLMVALLMYGGKPFSSLVEKTPLDSFVQVRQSYAVDGPPSLSVGFINRVLSAYYSPTAGLGRPLS